MTTEQELMAEKVIQLHKDNNGIYDWKDFVDVFNTTHDNRLVIGRALRDKDFIGDHTTGTRLKEQGWNFKGFEAERQNEAIIKERQKRKDRSDILDLEMKELQVRTKYLPYIVSFGALIVSICSYFKPEKKQQDLQPMQTEIQVLKEHMTRMDSLFRADTLSRKRKK